jgi:hypothetical protein
VTSPQREEACGDVQMQEQSKVTSHSFTNPCHHPGRACLAPGRCGVLPLAEPLTCTKKAKVGPGDQEPGKPFSLASGLPCSQICVVKFVSRNFATKHKILAADHKMALTEAGQGKLLWLLLAEIPSSGRAPPIRQFSSGLRGRHGGAGNRWEKAVGWETRHDATSTRRGRELWWVQFKHIGQSLRACGWHGAIDWSQLQTVFTIPACSIKEL